MQITQSNNCRPFHPHYLNEEHFDAALELYNKQIAQQDEEDVYSRSPQRWEYKGEVRASFQLCVSCKDIGKIRSFKEKYYLNVLEVRRYRTILCNGCMGYMLSKQVGTCINEIMSALKELENEELVNGL